MKLLASIGRWLGRPAPDPEDPGTSAEAEAQAKQMAYDRDSIRSSQNVAGRPMSPTPGLLHPHEPGD